jgi:PIN domain nuclease of toxin-antitoxin system
MRTYRILTFLLALSALLAGCAQEPQVNEVALALTVAAVQTENAAGTVTQPTLAPSPTPVDTPTPGECLAEVTQNNINMRRDPEGVIIGCCLADGEELKVRDFSADREWALIESLEVPAHRGWVDVKFLRLYGDCGEE